MNHFGCYYPFLVKALKTPLDQSKLVGERWHSILKETLTSQLCGNNQVTTNYGTPYTTTLEFPTWLGSLTFLWCWLLGREKRVKGNVKGITSQAIFSEFIAIVGKSLSIQLKHP